MTYEETVNNLITADKFTHEQRLKYAQKTIQTKKEKRAKKEQFAMGANFAIDVLKKKKDVKINGVKKRMTVYELVTERAIEMLLDKENPKIAMEMLKFLAQLTQGNPKLYAQFNITNNNNNVNNALPDTAEDRKAEFRKLMGYDKEEAEIIEAEVKY